MTFNRTKITTSNDTDTPRVVHLGSDVIWYVYRRADKGLYLQREAAGVRGLEVLVALPVTTLDVAIDPGGLKAWIYFVTDGSLRRIEVTDKTETPTTQAVQRNSGWYERLLLAAPGMGVGSSFPPTELLPPIIGLFDSTTPGQRALIIIPSAINIGRVAYFRLFRDTNPAGAGFQLYATLPLALGATFVLLDVPAAVAPQRFAWLATAVRSDPGRFLESDFSNFVVDKGQVEGDIVRAAIGMGVNQTWDTIDRTPIKFAAPTDNYNFNGHIGMGVNQTWDPVDRTPIKYAAPTDSYNFNGHIGMGVNASWSLNGVDVLNP